MIIGPGYARLALLLCAFMLSNCSRAAEPELPAAPTINSSNTPYLLSPTAASQPGAAPTYAPSATAIPAATVTPSPLASATPSPGASPLPRPTADPGLEPELAARELRMLEIINQTRAQAGLPPYVRDMRLDQVARSHSCDMATKHFIAHESSDGRTMQERIRVVDPAWSFPSESIAAGSDDPQIIHDMWMDEPPDGWHRRNILDASNNIVGIGYCYAAEDPSNNHHYWTMDVVKRP